MRRQARLAQEFAAALEGRGVSSARRDPALGPLLALAEGLQAVPLAPTADFRDALRQRLVAVAGVAPAPVAVPSPAQRAKSWVEGWRVQRAMAALAGSMAAVVGLTGVSVAASRSLPGDAFYGVKRTAEGVQVSLARNDVNRGKRHLQHAETRLHEIGDLVGTDIALAPSTPVGPGAITVAFGGSRSTKVASALHAMDTETREGTSLLFGAYVDADDNDLLVVVRDFTERQRNRLGQVLDSLPTEAHDDAEASIALVSSLNLRATQLLAVGTETHQAAPVPQPVTDGVVPVTPTASPTYDDLGPVPCTCPGDPNATEPAPTPEPRPTPSPTSSPSDDGSEDPGPVTASPQPDPSHYELPSQVPEPVASPVESVVDKANDVLPTPVPTLPPLPVADAPQVPGVEPAKLP
jgi:hypothetical protein